MIAATFSSACDAFDKLAGDLPPHARHVFGSVLALAPATRNAVIDAICGCPPAVEPVPADMPGPDAAEAMRRLGFDATPDEDRLRAAGAELDRMRRGEA